MIKYLSNTILFNDNSMIGKLSYSHTHLAGRWSDCGQHSPAADEAGTAWPGKLMHLETEKVSSQQHIKNLHHGQEHNKKKNARAFELMNEALLYSVVLGNATNDA